MPWMVRLRSRSRVGKLGRALWLHFTPQHLQFLFESIVLIHSLCTSHGPQGPSVHVAREDGASQSVFLDDGARVRHSRVVRTLHFPKVVLAFLLLLSGVVRGVLSSHCSFFDDDREEWSGFRLHYIPWSEVMGKWLQMLSFADFPL